MNRRSFVSKTLLATAATQLRNPSADTELYEIRIYEMRTGIPASYLEDYLKNALIPALNRLGSKQVGAFKEWSKSEPARIYVIIPYPSATAFGEAALKLKTDKTYQEASENYRTLTPEKAAFFRYKSSILRAFDGFPHLKAPDKQARIFELRTYEGYSEDAVKRKVSMFNDAEIKVFLNTGLHPVFFGEVIIGDSLPCLTYMLTFRDMEERDANWKAFSNDPDWKRISGLAEYANTVSRIQRIFLEPVSYSQI
ncbi:MAG: NIPSNAP family protein [Siphonobacter sp.]